MGSDRWHPTLLELKELAIPAPETLRTDAFHMARHFPPIFSALLRASFFQGGFFFFFFLPLPPWSASHMCTIISPPPHNRGAPGLSFSAPRSFPKERVDWLCGFRKMPKISFAGSRPENGAFPREFEDQPPSAFQGSKAEDRRQA